MPVCEARTLSLDNAFQETTSLGRLGFWMSPKPRDQSDYPVRPKQFRLCQDEPRIAHLGHQSDNDVKKCRRTKSFRQPRHHDAHVPKLLTCAPKERSV